MTAHILTIDYPTTSLLLNSNDRGHWRKTRDRELYWKERGVIAARGLDQLPRAQIDAWFRFPTNHRRDVVNLYPTIKSWIDGAVQAGILPDDSDRYLDGPFLRREWPNGPLRIKVAINELVPLEVTG
ncbi:hypothetical protein [Streptomyces sp.]|uniref:hypothetical protein n=1 Tax=Streptomyces sp. TaxID=1931 RepID=UPI002F935E34